MFIQTKHTHYIDVDKQIKIYNRIKHKVCNVMDYLLAPSYKQQDHNGDILIMCYNLDHLMEQYTDWFE